MIRLIPNIQLVVVLLQNEILTALPVFLSICLLVCTQIRCAWIGKSLRGIMQHRITRIRHLIVSELVYWCDTAPPVYDLDLTTLATF